MSTPIIVTGAGGQTGQEIARLASASPRKDFLLLQRADLDITNAEAVTALLEREQPSALINCAAYTKVDQAEKEPDAARLINGIAPGIMAAACAKHGCRFIHISTDYVFDGKATKPLLPTDPVDPINTYGRTKLEGEASALANNADTIIVRTAWVFSEFGNNFVKTMLRLMSHRTAINVVSDQSGSPTYARDLASALVTIAEAPQAAGGIYHYSNSGICSWYEFAEEIASLAGLPCKVNPIPSTEYPTPAARPKWSVMETEKIKQAFDIEIRDWKTALTACIKRIQG